MERFLHYAAVFATELRVGAYLDTLKFRQVCYCKTPPFIFSPFV